MRSPLSNLLRILQYLIIATSEVEPGYSWLRSPRADMVRNLINRPDDLLIRPDRLINRPDDLLICPDDLLIRPDELLIRPDVLI